jgi:hypothetical protein
LVNLSYVTARVSHRPQTLYGYITNTVRKDSAVHVSLSSYLIVKQQSLVKQICLVKQIWSDQPATRLPPAPKRLLPGFFTGWLLGPRNSRETIRAGRPRQRWRPCPFYRSRPLSLSTCVFKKLPKRSTTATHRGKFSYLSSYLLQLLTPVAKLHAQPFGPADILGHSVFWAGPRKESSSRRALNVMANMAKARGRRKSTYMKDSKASTRTRTFTSRAGAPTPAARHAA